MNEKQYVSVICEYNPFHHGHLYQLKQLKAQFSGVVCILSGNVVQRGSVAVADKYVRARAALNSGADLVLELPLPWCCASAKDFAAAGVHIAKAVGSHYLAFGAEDSLESILKLQALTSSAEFDTSIKNHLAQNKNSSYPAAIKAVVSQYLGDEFASIIDKPNNILAIEYINALKNSNLKPFAVKRYMQYLSSSAIRATGNEADILNLLPSQSKAVFGKEQGKDFCRSSARLDSFFVGTLRRMAATGICPENAYSTPADLANKIFAAAQKYSTVDQIIVACTDKIYTQARVRRGINSLVFGITTQALQSPPPYTSVLAANSVGREILRNAKKQTDIDIITKPVHAQSCNEATQKAFNFAKGIEDITALSAPAPAPADAGKTPYIIGD